MTVEEACPMWDRPPGLPRFIFFGSTPPPSLV